MDENIESFIRKFIEINKDEEILFKKLYGFYFTFRTTHTRINSKITSSEIIPLGIIYEENDEYYFAPIHNEVKIEEIIKNFVEKELKIKN